MPTDAHGQPGPARASHRLADGSHARAGQSEPVGVQDRLVTELQRVEAGRSERFGAVEAGAHDPRRPAVRLAQPQPGVNGLGPSAGIADRVAAGQAHADLDAIGDRGARVVCEHDGLVATGGEVAERVVLAVQLEQAADRRLVLAGERILGALRLEQHHRREHQCHGSEQPEQRPEHDVGVAGEEVGVGEREAADPVQCVRQPFIAGQRAGEGLEQRPGQQGPDRHPGHQHDGSFQQRTTAHPGVELAVRQQQQHDCGHVQPKAQDFAGGLEPVLCTGREIAHIPTRGEHQVEQQQPPRNAFAGGEGSGEERQHERPGEAGVGEVEDVVVDELAWDLDDPPRQRREAGHQR